MPKIIKKLKLLYISPCYPKECGIANYTQDLKNAYASISSHRIDLMAIDNKDDNLCYPGDVQSLIQHDNPNSYIDAARKINKSDYELVHVQHEFGLYGGRDGQYLMNLIGNLKKPYTITFHTVLSNPDPYKVKLVRLLSARASAIIVMADEAISRLTNVYGIEKRIIHKISHGVPEIPYGGEDRVKKLLNLEGRKIISTFGLISQNKGIEYVIGAIPKIASAVPEILYLIIGKTHPEIRRRFGEQYRDMLVDMIRQYKIKEKVKFINNYLQFDDLVNYLQATDLYITPYLEPQQITSGTLAYALGAGKVCISTPYAYAEELLSEDRGCLVPFRNSTEIADKALELLVNEKLSKSYSMKSYKYSRNMLWENVAKDHLDLFSRLLN